MRTCGWLGYITRHWEAKPSFTIDVDSCVLEQFAAAEGHLEHYVVNRAKWSHAAVVFRDPESRALDAFAIDIRVNDDGWKCSIHKLTEPWCPPYMPGGQPPASRYRWTLAKILVATAKYNLHFGIYNSHRNNCQHWAYGLAPFMEQHAPALAEYATMSSTKSVLGPNQPEAQLKRLVREHEHSLEVRVRSKPAESLLSTMFEQCREASHEASRETADALKAAAAAPCAASDEDDEGEDNGSD